MAAPGTVTGGDGSHLWLNPWGGSGSSINLTAGTLSTARPIGNGTVGAVATVNLNGGVLQAAANNFNILENAVGPTTVNVLSGGAKFNTNGNTATVATALLHSGAGVDGGLTKLGAGTLILSGTDTYTGGTTVSAGTLRMNNAAALGSTSATLTVNGGALDLNGNALGVGNLTGTGGSIYNNAASGNVALTIGNSDAGGGNYAGTIADNNSTAGTLSLVKTGTGAITLSGANTYSGGTSLNNGTLRVSNMTGSATGTGNVTLAAGTLASGPVGIIGGNVIAGGTAHTIAPGGIGSIGTLTLGGLTTNSNTTLAFDLGSPVSGGTYNGDLITIGAGGLDVSNGATLSFASNPTVVGNYRLFGGTFAGATQANFTFPTAPSDLTYSLLSPANDSGYFDLVVGYLAQSGQWNVNGPGAFSYNVGANWDSNSIPNAPGVVATFGGGPVTSGAVTVNIDAADVAGSLVFNNATTVYTLANSGGSIKLNNSGNMNTQSLPGSLVDVQAGAPLINASLILADSAGNTFNVASGATLTVSGPGISEANGTQNLLKTGAGTLTINAPSTYTGSTTVHGGTLRTTASGAIGGGSAILDATNNVNSTLYIGGTQNVSNLTTQNDTGTGVATLRVASGGSISVNTPASTTNTFQGNLTLDAVQGPATVGGILTVSGANAASTLAIAGQVTLHDQSAPASQQRHVAGHRERKHDGRRKRHGLRSRRRHAATGRHGVRTVGRHGDDTTGRCRQRRHARGRRRQYRQSASGRDRSFGRRGRQRRPEQHGEPNGEPHQPNFASDRRRGHVHARPVRRRWQPNGGRDGHA